MAAGMTGLTFMMRGNQKLFFRAATFVALKYVPRSQYGHLFPDLLALPTEKIKARSVTCPAGGHGYTLGVGQGSLYKKHCRGLGFRRYMARHFRSQCSMFWGFISGLMLLAGAHLSSDFTPDAARARQDRGRGGPEFS